MFSRRHPYLFFILVMMVIMTLSNIAFVLLGKVGKKEPEGEKIGVIEIAGTIMDSRLFLEDIKKFREDDTIQAIVIRIDSPGGGVGPSQEIYAAIRRAGEKKPVIASLGSVAASGGYYAASATDGIMSNQGTITGSIGVILGYTNFGAIIEKIGLKPVVIKSGENKDMGSPVKDLTPEQEVILQTFVDRLHKQFVRDVAQGRGMKEEEVALLADGRIYSGEEALEIGLVDRIGNFEDALTWAAEEAGISDTKWYPVYPERDLPFLARMLEGSAQSFVDAL
ncbi:signal peptide peptidase SppA, partial [Desulfococcaceae bacterium OttesenSCG-928-F15]|nr:signal peptide peptidase SppA [Desulfococcaceae bacterium OttesenSCG-928-F15]